jgi:transposase
VSAGVVVWFGSILGGDGSSAQGGQGMYDVHDWAEVHRLHHVEGLSKAAVAAKLSMSRTTVHRLLGLSEPPKYVRRPPGSQVDEFAEAIAAMLDADPRVPATVIAERLRPAGFTGSLTILKDHLRRIRPTFLAARCYQRTSYQPGELAQTDWWEPGISVPVGRGQVREVFGLVTGCRSRRRSGWCSPLIRRWPRSARR